MKSELFPLMAVLAALECGCGGMILGGAAFGASAAGVKRNFSRPFPDRLRFGVSYDHGVSAASELDYAYRLTEEPVPPESLLHEQLEFSDGTCHGVRVSVRADDEDEGYVLCLVGYSSRTRDCTMDGTTRRSPEHAWHLGGEIADARNGGRVIWFARFVGGVGTVEIPQTATTPMWPSADVPELVLRYAQLAGGIGFRLAQWGELRFGVAVDMIAFGHPGGHMNDTILGGENADKTVGAFLGLALAY